MMHSRFDFAGAEVVVVGASRAGIGAAIADRLLADGWSLSLIGRNLTDKQWINTSGPAPFVGGGDDQVVTLNRGRQVFVEVGFKF